MTPVRFWKAYARSYDLIWNGPVVDQVRTAVHSRLGTPLRVIDLGCGTGLLDIGLRERGVHVTGVDTSLDMLRRAVDSRRISEAVHAAAESTGLPGATADAVTIGNLLHLHNDPTSVVEEARRLAAPGAPIIVTWPVPFLGVRDMFRADVRAGRPVGASIGAHLAREWVGLLSLSAQGPVSDRARGADTDRLQDLLEPGAEIVAGCSVVGEARSAP